MQFETIFIILYGIVATAFTFFVFFSMYQINKRDNELDKVFDKQTDQF